MKQIIAAVTLGVTDLARSRAFYVGGLAWEPVMENEHIIFFQMNGCVLGLFARAGLEEDMKRPCTGTGAMALAHNVPERAGVDEVMAQAVAAGASVLKAPEDMFWGGYSGYFADPDGHAWEVAWNPAWPIGEDGWVRFGS